MNGGYLKSHDSQIVPKCDLENWGTAIKIGILRALINIMSTSILSSVHDTSGYSEMQKD